MDVNEMFENNKKLVFFTVNRIFNSYNLEKNALEREDMIQTGYIGLWKACKNFNPDYNLKFSTYAIPLISGEIFNESRDKFYTFKVPRESKLISKQIARKLDNGEAWPTIKEVQEEFGCSKDIARVAIEMLKIKVKSLYSPDLEGVENALNITELIEDENSNFVDKLLLYAEIKERCSTLTEREKKVVQYTLEEHTQSEIGKMIGLSQVQISRIYKKAVEKIKNYYEVKNNENESQLVKTINFK